MAGMERSEEKFALVPSVLCAVPAALLLLATTHMPYGYYQFLRLAVCGGSAFASWLLFRRSHRALAPWALVILALLYNPVFIVHLSRREWRPINLISAVVLVLVALTAARRSTSASNQGSA